MRRLAVGIAAVVAVLGGLTAGEWRARVEDEARAARLAQDGANREAQVGGFRAWRACAVGEDTYERGRTRFGCDDDDCARALRATELRFDHHAIVTALVERTSPRAARTGRFAHWADECVRPGEGASPIEGLTEAWRDAITALDHLRDPVHVDEAQSYWDAATAIQRAGALAGTDPFGTRDTITPPPLFGTGALLDRVAHTRPDATTPEPPAPPLGPGARLPTRFEGDALVVTRMRCSDAGCAPDEGSVHGVPSDAEVIAYDLGPNVGIVWQRGTGPLRALFGALDRLDEAIDRPLGVAYLGTDLIETSRAREDAIEVHSAAAGWLRIPVTPDAHELDVDWEDPDGMLE